MGRLDMRQQMFLEQIGWVDLLASEALDARGDHIDGVVLTVDLGVALRRCGVHFDKFYVGNPIMGVY